MKSLKIFIVAILTVVGMLSESHLAFGQNYTKAQLNQIVTELNKELPMEVEKGMTWTKISFNSTGTVMYLTFKVDFKKMSDEELELTDELGMEIFNSFSDEEFKGYLGEDFAAMMLNFGCDVEITLEFPNGTSKKYKIKK